VAEAVIAGVTPSPPLIGSGAVNDQLWHIPFNRLESLNEQLVTGREDVYFGAKLQGLPSDIIRYYVDMLRSDRPRGRIRPVRGDQEPSDEPSRSRVGPRPGVLHSTGRGGRDHPVLVFTSEDSDYFISHVDVTRIEEYRAEAAKLVGEPSIALLFHHLSASRLVSVAQIEGRVRRCRERVRARL
jgi:hypothetical protein